MHYASSSTSSSSSSYTSSSSGSYGDRIACVPPPTWAPYIGSVPLPQGPDSHSGYPAQMNQTSSSSLHPVLRHDRAGRLCFNITRSFKEVQFNRGDHLAERELALATRATRITIIAEGLSGPFTVRNKLGVTVKDVLEALFVQFQQQISQAEFQKLDYGMQKVAAATFHARTANGFEHAQGIKRVDCLGSKNFFIGLTPHGSDVWAAQFACGFTSK